MKKITFAIVGTGIVGERMIKQFLENPTIEVIALFDENMEHLAKMANAYQLHAASSFEEIISMKPDWVYIGTPPVSHARLSEQVIKAGLHVLCEKPLAHDAKDGEMMTMAAQEQTIQTAMHFPLMYRPAVRHMMKQIESGAIGDVVRIELCTYFPHWPRPWQQNPWIGSREQGGFTREIFPHYFQLMYRMFGHISIHDHNTTYPTDETLAETSVLAIGETENRIPVLINGLSGIGQEEELSYTVYGTEGVLKLRNWSELSQASKDSTFETLTSFADVKTLVGECVAASNGEEALLVSFEEGLKVQKLIDGLLNE